MTSATEAPKTGEKMPLAPVKRAPPLARMKGRDREFLPAALEILETPPSPIRMGLLVTICLFVLTTLTWSYFSRIDIIAIAQGKLQPTGRVKVIQPLETSRVVATPVENGERVKAGDVLVQLDPSDVKADVGSLAATLGSYRAEAIRRRAAIRAVESQLPPAALDATWPADVPPATRRRETEIYAADIMQLNAQIGSLQAQSEQKLAEQERLKSMIEAQSELIETLSARVAMRSRLVEMNAGSRANLIDATENLQNQKTTLAQQKGQLGEARANMSVFAKDMQRARDTFVAENAQKLADAERQVDDLSERLAKAQARFKYMTLRSPIDGIVQGSNITTIGQIVSSGQEVMRIVPDGASLEVECYLPNKDIGFVKVGDKAVLKIESFPFTRYGTIDAVVTRVARDAIPEPDAESIERGSTRGSQQGDTQGGQRTQNLVFPVTLHPLSTVIQVDGARIPLGAGMAVSAEILTGSRRILEYVLSPVAKLGSEAFKER